MYRPAHFSLPFPFPAFLGQGVREEGGKAELPTSAKPPHS